jgi:uncharacterized membrane protein
MKKRNMGYLIPLGIVLVFIGIIIIFLGTLQQGAKAGEPKTHIGIGGFIGPIPFGFANSTTMLYIVMGIAVFFFIMWLVLRYAL